MIFPVVLSLRGTQRYPDQDPEVITLVTEGILRRKSGGWDISYEESDLTGLSGVTTIFRVEGDTVTLRRIGKLHSEMIFREGFRHESLYRMDFGTLMMTVCAQQVRYDITEKGGTVDLVYTIDIEHTAAGHIEYHLDIRPR